MAEFTKTMLESNAELLKDFLRRKTNRTERDIEKHVENGMNIYEDSEEGFKEFQSNLCNGGSSDDEEGDRYTWNNFDKIAGFRFDFFD